MSDFVVSARKYRPSTFDSVVGQGSITTTLKNAIKNKHLAQAFLFCGPRGVGKTTCARILAKTINCFNISADTEACNECESCRSFNEGHSLNIYELDAASNNSVDDIRNLISQVSFAPQLGQYKVYIIDEVHMLSQAAFNAFLKTLEEPPKHAIFILATTEKHKILPTILSRCQIFDFHRISVEDIAKHLEFIAKSEKVKAEPDALHVIAQKADGALRDACSIFDQLVSFAGNDLTYKAVIDNLNVLDYDYYFKITSHILSANISQSLLVFNEILSNGFDGHHFLTGLAEHFRNLLVCKDASTLQLLEVSNNIRDKYKEQAAQCDQSLLLRALSLCSKADIGYKGSRNPRLLVELTLMQLCSLQNAPANGDEKKNGLINLVPKGQVRQPAITKAEEPKPVYNNVPENDPPPQPKENPQQQQQTLKKNITLSGGASINGFLNKKNQPDNNSAENLGTKNDLPADAFTSEELEKAWAGFARMMKEKGRMNLATTLGTHKPRLRENFVIEFEVHNRTQEEEIELAKTDMMAFIRKELKNYSIQLDLKLIRDDSEKKPYGHADTFRYMAQKNPALNKLKQAFDLEVDS
ncbi:MAG: DNA polymerase III subunit gamma/tau [Bacteroidota bacterium]